MSRIITSAIIHCSASEWLSLKAVTDWHTLPPPKGNGWRSVGYHYLILNRFTSSDQVHLSQTFGSTTDGQIVEALPVSQKGIHCKGKNDTSIGICTAGFTITPAQESSLLYLCYTLMQKHPLLTLENIKFHSEFSEYKTCPNRNAMSFRQRLGMYL